MARPRAIDLSPAFEDTVCVIGRRGSGKTYAAKSQIERFLADGKRLCIVDPTSVWWGLRASADGRKPGFPVVVFGGEHADIDIDDTQGESLGLMIAGEAFSSIVDVSLMTTGGRTRFMTAFLESLYHHNRQTIRVVFDEADMFAPQRVQPDETVLLNRMETLVRRGRVRGFYPWYITQRPAALSKSVMSQADTMVCMRLVAPQDRAAMKSWIEGQADVVQGRAVVDSLPSMPVGTGWVWSPGHEILHKHVFPKISTFDSSATPKEGKRVEDPQALAPVDLPGLASRLVAATEVVTKTAGGKRSASGKGAGAVHVSVTTSGTSVADFAMQTAATQRLVDEARLAGLAQGREEGFAQGRREGSAQALVACRHILAKAIGALHDGVAGLDSGSAPSSLETFDRPVSPVKVAEVVGEPAPAVAEEVTPTAVSATGKPLSKAERLILQVLCQYPSGRSKNQVALMTGYAHSGGGFNNAISSLRSQGAIEGTTERLVATATGHQFAGVVEPLPSGRALLDHWFKQCGKAERQVLEALSAAYPRGLVKTTVAARTGYAASGGGFNNALSRLRTLGLITGRNELRIADDLVG